MKNKYNDFKKNDTVHILANLTAKVLCFSRLKPLNRIDFILNFPTHILSKLCLKIQNIINIGSYVCVFRHLSNVMVF